MLPTSQQFVVCHHVHKLKFEISNIVIVLLMAQMMAQLMAVMMQRHCATAKVHLSGVCSNPSG